MSGENAGLSWFERQLSRITRVRPGEGRAAFLFFMHAFLLLATLQVAKALREAFILTQFEAEARSYAVGLMALLLIFIVPLYTHARRRVDGDRLLRIVTACFVCTLPLLAFLGVRGVPIALVFYLWVGIYGLMVISQMWAYAADSFNVKSGQRLFVVIMLGANLGALFGARFTSLAVESLTPTGLMILSTVAMAATLLLAGPERAAIPPGSRAVEVVHAAPPKTHLLGGIGLVLRDRYLLMIAAFMVLLNLINSTGEFILNVYVKEHAVAATSSEAEMELYIANFFGNFHFWVTLISLAIQLLLVSRIYQKVGVKGALLVHPVIVAFGYGVLAFGPLLGGFIPIFSLIRRIKVADNGVDYSLMNTTRQALFLPVNRESKFDGKLAIDTFFVRCGDLLQAAAVFVGLHVLGWTTHHFAIFTFVMALLWIVLALQMGKAYASQSTEISANAAPEAVEPIPDLICAPGRPFEHIISPTAFRDPDPGDVLVYRACCADGKPLPRWLRFDAWRQTFTGTPPVNAPPKELRVAVIASDMDGLKARSTFLVRCAAG